MKENGKATKRRGSVVCCILLWINPGARGEHLTSYLDNESHVFALST